MKSMRILGVILKAKGMKQVELAKKMKVTENTISRWINGTMYPSREHQFKLCKVLDVTIDQLNGDAGINIDKLIKG